MKVSILVRLIAVWPLNKGRRDRRGLYACLGEREVHTGFWWGNMKEKDHLKDIGVDELKRNSIRGRGLKLCGLG